MSPKVTSVEHVCRIPAGGPQKAGAVWLDSAESISCKLCRYANLLLKALRRQELFCVAPANGRIHLLCRYVDFLLEAL